MNDTSCIETRIENSCGKFWITIKEKVLGVLTLKQFAFKMPRKWPRKCLAPEVAPPVGQATRRSLSCGIHAGFMRVLRSSFLQGSAVRPPGLRPPLVSAKRCDGIGNLVLNLFLEAILKILTKIWFMRDSCGNQYTLLD